MKHQHGLVYGGGGSGQMGLLADTMLAGDGEVIGVIPTALRDRELMHSGVADMRVVKDMHVRKATMHSLADAYLILPGGIGTLEELFETMCWAQLGFHSAPIGLFNHDSLYDSLFRLLDDMKQQGFITDQHIALLEVLSSAEECDAWLARISSGTASAQ